MHKGDYRPLVFLLTYGQPTDDYRPAATAIRAANNPKIANIYAIGCGPDVDTGMLREITDIVLTHHHPDHIGAAAVCAARYGVGIWAHPWTAEKLRGKAEVQRLGKLEDHGRHSGLAFGRWDFAFHSQRSQPLPAFPVLACHAFSSW